MFTRNVAKLSLAVLSALVITAGPSMAKADDSAAEHAFQLEWLKYQLQIQRRRACWPCANARIGHARNGSQGRQRWSGWWPAVQAPQDLTTPADPIGPGEGECGQPLNACWHSASALEQMQECDLAYPDFLRCQS